MRSAVPKVLHEIGGRTLLGHVLHAVAPLHPQRTLVVVGHAREAVTAALAGIDAAATPVVQPE
ncbi:MAG TPA: NTP transferase domain-containing protein, partial [Mycobacteriales bacterium]|nr:NTP transferase domain-containing protein [Mycobacteriales bacterium]